MATKEFIEKLINYELNIVEKNKDILEYIKKIPHLDLGVDVNLEVLQSETLVPRKLHPHKLHSTKNIPVEYLSFHEKSFQGVCLFDIDNDEAKGMSDYHTFLYKHPRAKFAGYREQYQPTTAGLEMPYLIETLLHIAPSLQRTKLIKTKPSGGITWHSHHNNIYKIPYPRLCVLNIPIKTNIDCLHGVRKSGDKNAHVHWKNYKEGHVYLFNSWHDHCFWNKGHSDRWAVIPYFNFSDQSLIDLISKRIEKYKGPLID